MSAASVCRRQGFLAILAAVFLAIAAHPLFAEAVSVAAPSCAASAGYTPICGVQAPEDLELLPDGRHMIVSQLPIGPAHDQGGGLALLDMATDRVTALAPTAAFKPGWGEASCTTPLAHLGSHGINLFRRRDGLLELLVVNHIGRESVEAFEVRTGPQAPILVWHGCVTYPPGALNDVAGTPDGGFVATVALERTLLSRPDGLKVAVSGVVTGYLIAWSPGGMVNRLPGSDAPFNNGIQLSPDGRYAYFNAWTASSIMRYDLRSKRVTATLGLGFHPDNLSIRADGKMIAAGIDELGSWGHCMAANSSFCATAITAVVFDPKSMSATPLFHAAPGLIAGASVALETKHSLYIGTYMGDRIVKVRLDTSTPTG